MRSSGLCVWVLSCVWFCVVLYGFLSQFNFLNIMMCSSPVFLRKIVSNYVQITIGSFFWAILSPWRAMLASVPMLACVSIFELLGPDNLLRSAWCGRDQEFAIEVAMGGECEREGGCGRGWRGCRSGA